jgi:DNA-binding NarL/FixJ family response regulator
MHEGDETVTRIALVAGSRLSRIGLSTVLRSAADMELVAEAADLEQAIIELADFQPDVIVVEIVDGGPEVMDLISHIELTGYPGDQAVLLLADTWDEGLAQAMRAGARGVLLADSTVDRLVDAIRLVAAGYSVAPISHDERRDSFIPDWAASSDQSALNYLSERERDVLRLVASGYSNDEISTTLSVSASTVKSHVRRMLTKLRVSNRSRLVVFAFETGIVDSAEECASADPP